MLRNFLRWLASFRLRILFRTAFLLLILSVAALALTVLREEKQRGYRNYQQNLAKTKDQIVARLRHPSGQLALLNPSWTGGSRNLHPVLLPFSAIDFDDQNKVRHAIEMSDCLVHFENHASLCVAIGANPWIGGFIYVAGTFASGPLAAHEIGDRYLDGAHRMRVSVRLRKRDYRWLAPFEPLPSRPGSAVRGRFTGYEELDGRDYNERKTVREFRGWVWQEAACLDTGETAEDCRRRSFFSLRLPVEELIADLLRDRRAPWPPPDLGEIDVRIAVLPPGDGPALFDSASPGRRNEPFSLDSLGSLLQAGETLRIRRKGAASDLALIQSREQYGEGVSPLIVRLIRRLPVEDAAAREETVILEDAVDTRVGDYLIELRGEAGRAVIQALSSTATRLTWFVGAILAAIVLAWLVIEIGIVRRIARLTSRSRQLMRAPGGARFPAIEFTDLKGSDEMGILAGCLNHLLRRVREDAERERIRAAQEKEQWHAVGHEIMSPLQSLLALHGGPDDPDYRYLARMRQALRILYGAANPGEALQSSTLEVSTLDLDAFLANIAANAHHAGIDGVRYEGRGEALRVCADEYALEDVMGHLLNNAARHRAPGTPILLALAADETSATVRVFNEGEPISPEWQEKIFEYGFSGAGGEGDEEHRGQGLFVAKTYLAKMGGTIRAENEAGGVAFRLELLRADERE